ncbi:MAG: ABC transporter permease [Tepidisphaeraceae bacterium]
MTSTKTYLSRFLSDYGMSVVLVLLCAFFSLVTIEDRPPTGAAAANALARDLQSTSNVLILSGVGDVNVQFADVLQVKLHEGGKTVVERVSGSPADVRAALQRSIGAHPPVDAIAMSSDVAALPFIGKLREQFPALANARLVSPQKTRWPTFLNRDNLLNVATQVVVIALLAVGMTMVIITGGIDLSVGSLIALAAVVCAYCIQHWGGGHASAAAMIGAATVGIGVCALLGAFSGVLVTAIRLPPFIATLGVMQIARGVAKIIARGESIYDIPQSFTTLGGGISRIGIPNSVLLMLAAYVIAHIAMSRTTFGRYVYATGGNLEATRLSGVRVNLVRLAVYTISGAMGGLGGIVMTSQLKAGAPTYGEMYELKAIAAVVVGGTSLIGGSGKIFGTLIGALIIAVIENGMNLTGIQSYTQQVVLGAVILAAVVFDLVRRNGRSLFRR